MRSKRKDSCTITQALTSSASTRNDSNLPRRHKDIKHHAPTGPSAWESVCWAGSQDYWARREYCYWAARSITR
ncbi:hypothetical protein A2U01_0068121, partial [Trifolium medium]|nr:hypothetical protein [Trifolium medium]